MKNEKSPVKQAVAFPEKSIIWVQCRSNEQIEPVSKSIAEQNMDKDVVFIVTGPAESFMQLDPKLIRQALRVYDNLTKETPGVKH